MKEFWKRMSEDYKVEDFTKKDWLVAAMCSIGLLALMCLAGWIESL